VRHDDTRIKGRKGRHGGRQYLGVPSGPSSRVALRDHLRWHLPRSQAAKPQDLRIGVEYLMPLSGGWSSPEEAEGERLLHNGDNDEEAVAAVSALVADELPLLNDNWRAGGGRNLPLSSWRHRLVNMTMRKRRKLDGRLGAAESVVTSEKARRKRWRIVRWCCMGGFGGLVVL
jgi:hypothetical protein